MDEDSWLQGYFVGRALHCHLRFMPPRPFVVASMSESAISGVFDWLANISGTEKIIRIAARYTGAVRVSHSLDGRVYTSPVSMPEFLAENPETVFGNLRDHEFLWLRFYIDGGTASLSFTLYGYHSAENSA